MLHKFDTKSKQPSIRLLLPIRIMGYCCQCGCPMSHACPNCSHQLCGACGGDFQSTGKVCSSPTTSTPSSTIASRSCHWTCLTSTISVTTATPHDHHRHHRQANTPIIHVAAVCCKCQGYIGEDQCPSCGHLLCGTCKIEAYTRVNSSSLTFWKEGLPRSER